jgi:hypothetical protein
MAVAKAAGKFVWRLIPGDRQRRGDRLLEEHAETLPIALS